MKKSNISKNTEEVLLKEKNVIVDKMLGSFSEKFKQFEDMDNKNFSIPDNVLLLQDLAHSKGYTEDDEIKLDSELESMKQTFIEVRACSKLRFIKVYNNYFQNSFMISALEMENKKYAEIENIVEKEVLMHDKIHALFEVNNIQEIQSEIEAILDTITKTNLKL